MKIINYVEISLFFFFTLSILAQNKKWVSELSEDGKTEVVYAIYDSINVEGKESKYIEYRAKTKTVASLENCARVFRDENMHKLFYEYTEISKKVKDISEKEWIMYYYYSPPWPIADSDCVSNIEMKVDSTNNKIVFNSFSVLDTIEWRGVKRSELNNIIFTFEKYSNDETGISIEAILIPTTSAPSWMISSWFPEGPAGTLTRFKELAEQM